MLAASRASENESYTYIFFLAGGHTSNDELHHPCTDSKLFCLVHSFVGMLACTCQKKSFLLKNYFASYVLAEPLCVMNHGIVRRKDRLCVLLVAIVAIDLLFVATGMMLLFLSNKFKEKNIFNKFNHGKWLCILCEAKKMYMKAHVIIADKFIKQTVTSSNEMHAKTKRVWQKELDKFA